VRSQPPGSTVPNRGPLRSGALREQVVRDGAHLVRLAWAPLPAVPRSLTVTEQGIGYEEAAPPPAVFGSPSMSPATRLEADMVAAHDTSAVVALWTPPPVASNAPAPQVTVPPEATLHARDPVGVRSFAPEEPLQFGGRRRNRSETPRLQMSRPPIPRHAYSHAGDPLGSLPFADAGLPAPEFIMPFAHGRVTSLFNQGRIHPAIDLAGRLGSPVLATTTGQRVTFTGWRGGYGNTVMTRDAFGRTHLYAHLLGIIARVGQLLDQGDRLGLLGSTGHSTGPHVHYEVRTPKGVHINPVTLLFPGRRVSKGFAWFDVRQEEIAGTRLASPAAVRPVAARSVRRIARRGYDED
jgi:murein DD-endopeptidase MepM/ murein hydrolase activator NlpD